ncbi:hypothetical protein KI387_019242, partial [Taxus chinensis]
MDREEFLQGAEQQKPWGFQQLLTLDVGREDELLYDHEAQCDFMNSGTVQGFEPESCISHVSEPCTNSLGKHHGDAKYQHSGPEEGISSASCQDPLYSSANCKQKKTTAVNKRDGKKRKQRSKVCKNSEAAESQRMTHIAVERNRRKQMNQHLNVLKSLIPASFIERVDQASIIGGAIDFVKELEHVLQSLEAQKINRRQCNEEGFQSPCSSSAITSAFNGFFQSTSYSSKCVSDKNNKYLDQGANEVTAESKSAVADVEVTLVETHAALKILSQKRPGQLLQTISALENLHMSILHLNITTISHSVLYSFNLK